MLERLFPSARSHRPEHPLALRDASYGDDAFLFSLYASSRADEMAIAPWDAATKLSFLRGQHEARNRHYADNYSNATQSIVLCADIPVAAQWVARWTSETRLMDLVVAQEWRNRGIGTQLVNTLQQESDIRGARVSVHVWDGNPAAARFYRRLGFEFVSTDHMYSRLEWPSGQDSTHRSSV
jgi:ribosomal protein S18 acetylase RimI-like enzyme